MERNEKRHGARAGDAFAPGTPVLGRDRDVGTVVGMREDPTTHEVAYLLVREPHLLALGGTVRLVPIAWVKETSAERIVLDADLDTVRRCPALRDDAEVQEEVTEAIWAVDTLRPFRLGVDVRVHEGVVELTGNVATEEQKEAAEEAARTVPGVLEVRNRLADDETLQLAVAQVLTEDPVVRAAHLDVYCDLGKVQLFGRVPSEEAFRTAMELARAVPGVREVENHLDVVEDPSDRRA